MSLRVVFAGGGTGGHIFPALAIAEALLDIDAHATCVFACSSRPLDAQILGVQSLQGSPARFVALPATPPALRPRAAWKFLCSWGPSVRAVRALLRERPACVVTTGGFVAAPAAQAARASKVPLVMVNLDAVPGKANRWIAARARCCITSAALAPHAQRPGWEVVRPIVRGAMRALPTPASARQRLGLALHRPTLLITGGSQGATSINRLFEHAPPEIARALAGWNVLHQSGQRESEGLARAYAAMGVQAHVVPFIDAMDVGWAAADVAICRSGAGNVAEAWASGVPSIFLPYPYHKDEHQRWNAQPLADAGAGLIVQDRIEPEATWPELARVVLPLLMNATAREQMRERVQALGEADGASAIARRVLEIAR